jgi:hypothetical protein
MRSRGFHSPRGSVEIGFKSLWGHHEAPVSGAFSFVWCVEDASVTAPVMVHVTAETFVELGDTRIFATALEDTTLVVVSTSRFTSPRHSQPLSEIAICRRRTLRTWVNDGRLHLVLEIGATGLAACVPLQLLRGRVVGGVALWSAARDTRVDTTVWWPPMGSTSIRYDVGSYHGASLFEIDLRVSGAVKMTCETDADIVLAFGAGIGKTIAVGAVVGGVSVVAAFFIFVRTFLRRRRERKARQAQAAPPAP